jgi:diguanylate cyclase (GGDEF)-like protein/PAS domain S-box-containing protein
MLGWSPEQLIGSSAFDRMYPDDIAGVRLAEAQLSGTVASRTIVFRVFRADGSLAWIEANFKRAPSGYGDDDETDIVAVLRDVTHRKAMEDQLNALNSRLAELATTDSLTGLANRRTLDVFLRREFASARRLSVLLLDIDHFKSFNDSLGHQAGDECLKSVAAVLADATAGTASLSARYGGEEFALILPDVTEEAALKIADEVRLKVRALGIVNGACDRGYVTVSIGIAAKSLGTQSEAALLGEADHALYAAKRQGRNRCVCASSLADTASLVPEDCFGASS